MATSIICCCAPIYKSIIPEINMFSSFGSWASRTFNSKSSRSKFSDKSSDKYHKKPEGHNEQDPPWMQQKMSSEREQAFPEINLNPGHGGFMVENNRQNDKKSGMPVPTVQVK